MLRTLVGILSGPLRNTSSADEPIQGPPRDQPAGQVGTKADTSGPVGQAVVNPVAPGASSAMGVLNRYGTFIIPDVYPDDPTGANPPFHVLPGLTVLDKEVVGCYLKCSEGTGWGSQNEDWFVRNWKAMAATRTTRPPNTEFSRGAYHFLRFQEDGTAQANYFCDLIDRAGGWGEGDLMPWCDVESGGQGSWIPGGEDALENDRLTKAQLATLAVDVRRVTTAFVARVKARYPGIRVGLYGRGIFRDLGMTDCRFGADAVANPAYTAHPPDMTPYGWPLTDVVEWQVSGDGVVVAAGFPSVIPGWGATDYSVVINSTQRVSLADVRTRCFAFPGRP